MLDRYSIAFDHLLFPLIERYLPKPKPLEKCALPGCDKQTDHNGGYCCAEHCKEHRTQMRAANCADKLIKEMESEK